MGRYRHGGRHRAFGATAETVDVMAAVVEPSTRSIETALRVKKLAADIGIKRFCAVANKIKDDADIEFINKNLGGVEILSRFGFSQDVLKQDRLKEQDLLKDNALLGGVKELFDKLGGK